MLKLIDEKYCSDELVQLMPYTALNHLIISTDEVLLLKIGNKVLLDKYETNPSRTSFPFYDKENDSEHFKELFEYERPYLNIRSTINGIKLDNNCFYKVDKQGIYTNEKVFSVEAEKDKKEEIVDRETIERYFNPNAYNSMYIVNINGKVEYAKNKIDGIIIDKKIIPSDEDIVEIERRRRKINKIGYEVTMGINYSLDDIDKKSIDEIRDVGIYGESHWIHYKYIMITSQNCYFKVCMFNLSFVSKNKFRLITTELPVIVPSKEEIIRCANINTLEKTPEPKFEEEVLFSEAVKHISQKLIKEHKIKNVDYFA